MISNKKGSTQRGFSLIELMIVLVIVGVALALGLPGFKSVQLTTKLRNYSNEMVTAVYLARGEAIKRNGQVTLCASSNGSTCAASGDWEQGWVVLDPNAHVIQAQEEMGSGFRLAGTEIGTGTGVTSVTFQPSGLASPPSNFVLCRSAPTAGFQERKLTLLSSGRTKVETTTDAVCL
ncbi:MAG: GspH/FimT family pseudopilin [Halioglobus sp.]